MFLQIFLFVLFFFLALLLLAAVVLHRLFHQLGLDKIRNLLQRASRRQATSGRTRWERRKTQTPSGDTIIDRRSPKEASQKIFRQDEGEYTDFEEEAE